MGRPLGHIRILMSSRVLFDLEKADEIFKKAYDKEFDKNQDKDSAREAAVKSYTDYVCCRGPYKKDFDPKVGGRRFEKGPLWHMAKAALKLNENASEPLVEVGMYCKDDAVSAMPVFRNLDLCELKDIGARMALAGHDMSEKDLDSFGADLLLTRNRNDAQTAINHDVAAAVINFPLNGHQYNHDEDAPVQIWVDGDAVAFGSSSEVRYREKGLDKYQEMESKDFRKSVEPGPFTKILAKISEQNAKFPRDKQPFEISLLTARGSLAAARVFSIAQDHGIIFNGRMYFMSGADKANPLMAHKPDLFVDDQMTHLEQSKKYCPTGLVTYKEGSPMYEFQQKERMQMEKVETLRDNAAHVTAPEEKETSAAPAPQEPSLKASAEPRKNKTPERKL